MRSLTPIIFFGLISSLCFAQPAILDPCFSSGAIGTSFASTANLGDVGNNADLCNWTGTTWTGDWPGANLTLPPPQNSVGCRAIWCGSGTAWTTGGEGFGVRLASGFVTGVTYTYAITYVSHGTGSTGAFAPRVFTNNAASLTGAFSLGGMPAVGAAWTTNVLAFTATAAQNGHNWLIFGTWPNFSSGFVNSFCSTCNTLPIELLSFEVKAQENKTVLCKWTTATELNNDFFVLQRSVNGTEFEDVSKIKGAGNSNANRTYTYLDKNPISGTSYYRLKQVDFDGTESKSELKAVNFTNYAGIKLYPNPTTGLIYLPSVQNDAMLNSDNAEIEISNYLGEVVLRMPYSNTIDVSEITGGYYNLKIKVSGDSDFSYKIIKQ